MEVQYKFDLRFLKYLSKLASKIFNSTEIWMVFCLLLLLRLLEEYVIYQVGLITSAYYKVLSEKDFHNFCIHTAVSVGLIFLISILKSCRVYVTSLLYTMWREQLTTYLHRLYFKHNNSYEVNVVDKSVDNPDQRITQDVDKMCLNLSNIVPTLLISPFTISYYIYSCYMTTGWLGPVGVFVYFVISTIINKILMSSVAHFVYLQEKREGIFRYKHMHIRMNAESIVFQHGQKLESRIANSKLDKLIRLQQKLVLRQLPLDFSVNLFAYFGSILSFMLLAGPVFHGFYDNLSQPDLSALISANAFVSIYLISCFTNLVSLSEPLAAVAGTTHRISQLKDFLKDKLALRKETLKPFWKDDFDSGIVPDVLLEVKHLNLTSPGLTCTDLVQDLTFQVRPEGHLLITGQSGCGKTTLLRVLKGLLQPSEGTFTFYTKKVLFLPQKTLLTDGSLRQQVLYPHEEWFSHVDDDTILSFLDEAELSHLVDRVGGLNCHLDWDWYDSLSPGEAQRLCFVRLFCQKPTLAFLDEALSAVSPQLEDKLYRVALKMNITLVSVGHRQSLLAYHKYNLHFHEQTWTLQDILVI